MKKLIIRLIALTVLISTMVTMVPVSAATTNVNTATYLTSAAQMETYMENEIKKISGYVSGSINFSCKSYYKNVGRYTAKELSTYYSSKHNGKALDNICVIVAIVNVINGLKQCNRADKNVSDKDIFCEIMDYVFDRGYYTIKGGISSNKTYEVFNRTLEFYELAGWQKRVISSCTKKSGCYSFLKNESVKSNGASFPVLYSMKVDGKTMAHAVAVSGCKKYTVTYYVQKGDNKIKYAKEYVFFVISDGNYAQDRYLSPYIVNNKSVAAYSVSYK